MSAPDHGMRRRDRELSEAEAWALQSGSRGASWNGALEKTSRSRTDSSDDLPAPLKAAFFLPMMGLWAFLKLRD